jgi:poly(A) polymerase
MPRLQDIWTPQASLVADLIAQGGGETRMVGGPVRDTLLGLQPRDFDLCTDAHPLAMLQAAAQAGIRTFPTLDEVEADPSEWRRGGLKHGTVPFVVGDEVVEVTTLRRDAVTDGRHAEVEFVSDFREDAARRDFTFNAMSVDRSGHLHDYFGGADDLAAGVVRFVGSPEARMQEDYLRILRYYRFRGRYGSDSGDENSAAACADRVNAEAIARHAAGLSRISGERIWSEMSRILVQRHGVSRQFPAMVASGVAHELGLSASRPAMAAAHLAACSGAPATIVAGLLISDGLREANSIVTGQDMAVRWKLSAAEAILVETARVHAGMVHAPFESFMRMAMEPRARRPDLAALLQGFGREAEARRLLADLPEFPLKGADLVEAGMTPGPDVGRTLASLRNTWCERGYVDNRQELLALLPNAGSTPSSPR